MRQGSFKQEYIVEVLVIWNGTTVIFCRVSYNRQQLQSVDAIYISKIQNLIEIMENGNIGCLKVAEREK